MKYIEGYKPNKELESKERLLRNEFDKNKYKNRTNGLGDRSGLGDKIY